MNRYDYTSRDACSLAALVRAGEVSVAELGAAATAQHQRTHGAINAVVEWYDPDGPLPGGRRAEGPLAGVPFLRKDIGSTEAGRLVEMGSHLAAGVRAEVTSSYFEAMVAAGVQVLGRTAVPEFAQHGTTETDLFGATRNPVDLATSAGGSSGGAAAAVRAGVVPIAHASDSAGSIRIPSAVTGLLGLKPSRGRIPSSGFDWNGLLGELVVGRSVRDLEACLAVLATGSAGPFEPSAPTGPTGQPMRIAVCLGHWADKTTDPVVTTAVESAAQMLQTAGHRVEPIGRPFDYEQLMSTWFPLFGLGTVDLIQATAARTGRVAARPHLEPNTCELLEIVAALPADARQQGLATGVALTETLTANLAGFDAVLTPTLDRAVIPLGHMAGNCPMDRYLVEGDEWFDRLYLANVTGWPAVSVPAPDAGPIPIGVQLMAPLGHDERLLSLARDIMGDGTIPAIVDLA